jgi:hypothetical protein
MFIVHLSFRYLSKKREKEEKKGHERERKEECNDLFLSFSFLLLLMSHSDDCSTTQDVILLPKKREIPIT